MPRATTIVRKAAVRPDAVVDTISLDHAGRQAQHAHLHSAGGLHIDLALAKAAGLEDGDALRLDDGRLVTVTAAPEDLLEIRAENPARLVRLAWQLGGNHVAAEIGADVLHVPASAATVELARGQGCTATPVSRAFRPERMAHDHSTCGHDHSHDQHAHAEHAHADPKHADHDHAPHVHGPSCGHDH